jgi:hypothetical protein
MLIEVAQQVDAPPVDPYLIVKGKDVEVIFVQPLEEWFQVVIRPHEDAELLILK